MKKSLLIFILLSIIIVLLGFIVYKSFFITKKPETNNSLTGILSPSPSLGIIRIFSLKGEEIQIINPQILTNIKSPITIEGEVRGPWFFEGSFSIKLEDKAGNLINQGVAQTSENWMSDDWVSFRSTIDFDIEKDTDTVIVLQKSNPSGLPENEDQATLDIKLVTK